MKLTPHLQAIRSSLREFGEDLTANPGSSPTDFANIAGLHPAAFSPAPAAVLDFNVPAASAFVGPLSLGILPASMSAKASPGGAFQLENGGAGFGGASLEGPVIAVNAAADGITQAQVDALEAGFTQTLSAIQSNLVAQVFADTLPVLGDSLHAAAGEGAAQLQFVTALKDAVLGGLGSLTGAVDYTEAQLESAINGALTAAGITGAGANLDLTNAADIKLTFTTGKNFAALTTEIAANLGLPGLGVSTSGSAQTTFNHTLNFGSGLDAAGFYVNTAPGASTFRVVANTTLPGFAAAAELSALKFSATDNAATPTTFNATFNMALKDANADGKLREGELGGDLLDATLTGTAAINLKLASDLGTAVLPDIAADLGINWGFSNAIVDPAAGIASFGNVPTVAFKNVSLGLGSFFSDFVNPIFTAVQLVTDPLQPIVDVLLTEIGFLSDLAGETVTLLDVAGGVGALDAETASRLELYADLINFINSVPAGGGDTRIDLGDFSLGAQDARGALFQLANAIPQSIRNALAPGSQNGDLGGFLAGKDALPGGGLSFPIIENPATAINLLFGKPVDFFTYHVPGLDIDGLGFDEFFRIFGPFGVRLTATVEAHVFLDIGYDSSGIAQFAASGDAADIFNGFYVVDQPGPEATLQANLQAFAAVNILIAELGVGGGITANINAFLSDKDFTPGDGRIHLGELSNSCFIELSGEVVAGLSAYLEIGIGPFSETYEKNFGTEVLVSFNVAGCDEAGTPGVPVLAHNTGSTVFLHVGADASLRQVGTLEDSAEDFIVVHGSGELGSETIGVIGNGLRNEDGTPVTFQPYIVGANGRITANGGELDDNLALAPDVLSPATLRGGPGNDRLVGAEGNDMLFGDAGFDLLVGGDGADTLDGGADQDYIDGEEGDDTLLGGADADILVGGPGGDVLNGGPGYDTASYVTATVGVVINIELGAGSNDAQGDSYISIERILGSPFADIMNGGAGSDNFSGGDGNDVLDGKGGDDLLVGDAGADDLTGGPGNDFAAYTLSPAGVNVSLLTGLATGGDAEGDTLHTIENLQGTVDFADTLEGDNGPNWLRGLNGANLLRGLGGADLLEGGKDNDTLEGGDGSDTLRASQDVASLDPAISGGIDILRGGAGNDELYGDAGADLLDGGADNDLLVGGKDSDMLLGGDGDDTLRASQNVASVDPAVSGGIDILRGGAGNDILYGDAGGDTLDGGEGNNQIYGGKDNDGISAGAGNDLIFGGAGADSIAAGDGQNFVFGENGNDVITAGSGPDELRGGAGNDSLNAGAGNNALYGDDGDDLLISLGGDDTLSGGIGNDRLEAGAGTNVLSGGDGADVLIALEGNDTLEGGDGDDQLDAGEGSNQLDGDAGNDLLVSGSGDDTIHGGTGNDIASSGAGNDFLFGEDDNDSLDAGIGTDLVDGGAGNDFLSVGALRGPVQDPERLDRLDGGAGFDTVTADFSNQTIPISVIAGETQSYDFADGAYARNFENVHDFFTGSGDDILRLEGAADDSFPNLLKTGAGNDTIYSGGGNDDVDAADGDDIVQGGAGADTLDGGLGRDVLLYLASPASVIVDLQLTATSGPAGSHAVGDLIANFEDLYGSGFDDQLHGTAGDNIIDGGDGNDWVHARAGRDYVVGGNGNDLLEVGTLRLAVQDAERADQIFGGAGFDTITADFSNQTIPITVIAGQTWSYTFADGALAHDFENVHDFATGSGDDVLRLDGAADDLFGNFLRTGSGNDIIYSGAGSDDVDAGDGDDFVNGGSNATVLLREIGFGTISGFTGPGETLRGGPGNDTISFVDLLKPTGALPGGIFGVYYGVLVNLGTNATDGSARGVTISGFENLIGTEYGDILDGDDGPNIINPLHGGGNSTTLGSGGPDRVDGHGGIDTLIIDFSREDLPTSTGVSSIGTADTSGTAVYTRQTPASPFSSSDQTYATGIERFHITGASKNDQITGGARGSEDIFIGLGGNDTLTGFGGSDILLGGEGDDILTGQALSAFNYFGPAGGRDIFDGGPGDDLIEDLAFNGSTPMLNADALFQLDGGAGFDTLSVDFSNQTTAIIWDGAAPTDMEFADGAYARNFEQLRNFVSGSGNDSITQLGRYDNVFHTSGGNDVVRPGLGFDTANGGPGDDLLVLDYSVGDLPTYTGVTGGGGNTIFRRDIPGSGQVLDYLAYTGFERLHITGTPRADTIDDFSGDDIIYGGAGNDVIRSTGGGNNYFDGGDGDDTLTGFSGSATNVDDTFIGGEGNDTLSGGSGNDTLLGGPGNDVLIGASLFGFAPGGLDFIDGGDGDDFVNESYAVSEGFIYMPAGTVLKLDGGAGFDILSADFNNQTQGIVFIAGQANVNEFPSGAYFRDFEQIIDFTTGSGNDVLTQPGRINNQFSTRAGDDIVNPGLGIDIAYGGLGDDLLILDYSLGDDANLGGVTFNGGSGSRRDTATNAIVDSFNNGNGNGFERFHVTGGTKADILTGGSSADILIGNGGNDTINGATGNDTIDAGPGDDRVSVEAANDPAMLDQLDGGAGFDVLASARFVNQTAPVLFDSRAPTSTEFADGAYFRNFEQIEQLATGSGADVLIQLGRVNNIFTTNAGDDVVAPGLGNDTVFGGPGTDTLILDYSESDGANVRMESSGLFFYRRDVATNAIVDQVYAPDFERYEIIATRNNDSITTGAADDVINVGRGSDTVNGAGGIDLLVLDWSAMISGAQGANYSSFNAATGTGTLTTSDAAGFSVVFANFERFDLTGTGLGDDLRGRDLADVLRGGGGDDLLSSGGGNDFLQGGSGNDTLIGGPGIDVLDGGEGDDLLQGGGGINGQWASSVISFTSQFSPGQYTAAQMLGVPNTFSYGSFDTAWAPAAVNGGLEQVVLGFSTPVYATGVLVRENWGNGFVTRIDLLDINDQFHTVFTGIDPSQPGTPVDFTINFARTDYLVKGVKIFVDKNHNLGTYEEIDAVQLQDSPDVADQVSGGPGNDIYLVEALGNLIIEALGEGVDEVRTQVNFVLPANVENLRLLGSAMAGTGNGLANVLTGNALANTLEGGDGNDTLDGGAGADTMRGGDGDDTYVVDSIADIIAEQAGEGNDTVNAVISYTLGANFENLILGGRALSGTGNAVANILTGNARNNDLHGGAGDDVLTGGTGIGLAGSEEVDLLEGGAGADTFVLGDASFRFYDDRSSLTPGTSGYAYIVDFTPSAGDVLKLHGTPGEYRLGTSPLAGVPGTGLFHDTDQDGVLDPSHDELIAVLQSTEALDLQNTVHAAIFI